MEFNPETPKSRRLLSELADLPHWKEMLQPMLEKYARQRTICNPLSADYQPDRARDIRIHEDGRSDLALEILALVDQEKI